jgi:hypothetical protein
MMMMMIYAAVNQHQCNKRKSSLPSARQKVQRRRRRSDIWIHAEREISGHAIQNIQMQQKKTGEF